MNGTTETITIDRRFRGPPESANGGYACGMLGRRIDGPARVRLLSPPPLDRPLSVRSGPDGVEMLEDDRRIAEGRAAAWSGGIPPAVAFDVAARAAESYRWATGHPFAGCFVCGPERRPGDGLCIFPGPVPDLAVVAAPWVPDPSVCDADGLVRPEVVWASLDCPSWFWLLEFQPGVAGALLGELTARMLRRPAAGEPCVAIGWARGRDGRKLYAGAALYGGAGELLGSSEAVWVELRTTGQGQGRV